MTRETIIGTNNTTPGAATAPSTLLTDTTTTTGLTITQGSGAPGTQKCFQVLTSAGVVVYEQDWTNSVFVNVIVGAAAGVFTARIAGLNGQQSPPCAEWADGTSAGLRMWSGTGAPGASTVGTARVGDWYLRRDTPSTANQRVYVCTVAGAPGTWTGIA